MTPRRHFMVSGTAALTAASLLGACSRRDDGAYARASQETWRPMSQVLQDAPQAQRALVRCATLAPSSHNTQCWKFKLGDGRISIFPDLSRRCPAVDPDDHHLWLSLGCATENMVQAAAALGFRAEAIFDAAGEAVHVGLNPAKPLASPLYEAIARRQCTRSEYDGRPASSADLKLLEHVGSGNGVRVMLLTDRPRLEQVLEYVVRGNNAQMADAAFVNELKSWIRFNADDAVATGDGLFAAASGNPTLPHWLGPTLMSIFFTADRESDKYAKHVRSSSGIAVFVSQASDKAHWVEAGRCYERFALQATALGMRNAMLNQPVEVAAVRPQFATWLGLKTGRPDLVVRFGFGPESPRSLRRPVDAVLT